MTSPLHPQEHSPAASLGLRDPCPSPMSPPVPPATSPGKRPMQVPCLPQALPGSPLTHSWALISEVPPLRAQGPPCTPQLPITPFQSSRHTLLHCLSVCLSLPSGQEHGL